MAKALKHADVVEALKKRQGSKSLREFARELGISAPYLSDIYRGHRGVGPAILKTIGLTRKTTVITVYEKTA